MRDMVKNLRVQRIIASALLLGAAGLLIAGLAVKHRVYDQDDEFAQFGMKTFSRVRDTQLSVDATFTGVTRKDDGKLYSTYNRTVPRGKKACPT